MNTIRLPRVLLAILACVVLVMSAPTAFAQSSSAAVRQAIAASVAGNKDLQAFYAARDYAPIWMGKSQSEKRRLKAFLDALGQSGTHALPAQRYDVNALASASKSARSATDAGKAEAALSAAFLQYARDVQSGILVPQRVNSEIQRNAPRRNPVKNLQAFVKSSPKGFLKALPPQTANYKGLLEEKSHLEKVVGAGGWGSKVSGSGLKPGQSGNGVTALRNRLVAMGYAKRSQPASYDQNLQSAVAAFQRDHGLTPDGIAGKGTLAEVNKTARDRLQQVVVAMERERWTNLPLGKRHIWVNIPDFSAQIRDGTKVTFESRTVVGKNAKTHRTPEFSDVMEYMVVNPTWNVPHSITTREYLPMLQANPNAVSHLDLLDSNGRKVSRASVNFASYSASNFPYRLKEPPSQGNALGLVKFMFPNTNNIYLHDTPSKSLFSRESRAFSHGCVRLADPIGFAHALLKVQTSNPESFFQARLETGRENVVDLKQPLRVHIVYRTAFTSAGKNVQYRRDVYGRDAQIYNALSKAGVSLRAVRG